MGEFDIKCLVSTYVRVRMPVQGLIYFVRWWADEADREKLVVQVAVLRPALRKDVSSASQAD